MDDIEKQKLEELFNRKPSTEVEAVELAKARLDACLANYGKSVEFLLVCKIPNENDAHCVQLCCGQEFRANATLLVFETLRTAVKAKVLGFIVPPTPSFLSKLRNLFKWSSK